MERLSQFAPRPRLEQVGRVEHVGDGIAVVSGLPDVRLDELVDFGGGLVGLAVDLGRDAIGCVLLGSPASVAAGARVRGTGAVARVPVGEALLGRVVDPLGQPLDSNGPIAGERMEPVDKPAPPIVDRAPVVEPLLTGLTVVDAMFPIGRGQRELIIGDRATGKTAIAVDAVLRQRTSDVVCVYVAIGQKSSTVRRVLDDVRAHGAVERCIFVIADASAAPGLQWLAPYSGFTMAEHFRDRGRHVLVVLDDLTKHAATHRQLALLLRQPPGREAYPGDVFHLHARLLERAAKLSPARGSGSLTALPIAETQAGDLSAYIPTNLISITDGQLVVDARLFAGGIKPAVDVGRSVSRVGGHAQPPAMRRLAERLRLEYAQFLELEVFTRFGATVDERTRQRIEHGRRIRAVLTQPRNAPWPLGVEVALLLALGERLLDGVALERIDAFKQALPEWLPIHAAPALDRIAAAGGLGDDDRVSLLGAMRALLADHG
jgi:F-type H+-transporting ATPase subunit alpha